MSADNHFSLSQLQSLIKERLAEAFPMPMWVVAEISELKVNYSGHCYLELVEKGGRNQVPKAKASAVIWRSSYGAISSYFRATTGNDLGIGMKVLVRAAVSYHELYGLSLQISDIDPRYTIGDMEQQRRQTVERLVADGVFDMNRELGLPAVPQRVAVVSSRNAAGYQDFMNELGASQYRFDTVLFDAFMQGNASEESIIAALDKVLEQTDDFDAVVLIRGGGSQSDLGCFDSYRLCCHLAQFPLPVITGIGHDKDQSVADMVAALSLKTPTAVAAYLVDRLAATDTRLTELYDAATTAAARILDEQRHRLRDTGYAMSARSADMTRSVELRLQRLAADIRRLTESHIAGRLGKLELIEQMLRQRSGALVERATARLDAAAGMIESKRPEHIMALGFAVVRVDGKAVRSAESLAPGSRVEIALAKGGAKAEITEVIKTRKNR